MHERTPQLHDESLAAMNLWFAEMANRKLILHPEDAADSIMFIENRKPFFSKEEADKIQKILDGFFCRFRDEAENDAAYLHSCGQRT